MPGCLAEMTNFTAGFWGENNATSWKVAGSIPGGAIGNFH